MTAFTVAKDGLQDPWVRAGSRMALQRRILRLGKPPRRWKTPSFAASIKRKITEVIAYLTLLGILMFWYSCWTFKSSSVYNAENSRCLKAAAFLNMTHFAGKHVRFMFKGDLWIVKWAWRIGFMEKMGSSVELSSLPCSTMLEKEVDGRVYIQRVAFGWLFLGCWCGTLYFLMYQMYSVPDFRYVFLVCF